MMPALLAAVLLAAPFAVKSDKAISIDGAWQLRLSDSGDAWRDIRVPGNLPFQGVVYDGVLWLRASFTVPAELAGRDLAVRLPMTANAYELFVNGQRAGGRGVIGPQGELLSKDFRAGVWRLDAAALKPSEPNLLELKVRTFYGNGGVQAPGVLLGPEELVREAHERDTQRTAMLFSLFAFAGFFHLVLFAGRRRERYHLAFAGIALSLASITAGINTFGYLVSSSPDFNAYLIFVPLLLLPYFFVRFFTLFFERKPQPWLGLTAGAAAFSLLSLVASTVHHPLYPFFERVVLPAAIVTLVLALSFSLWWTVAGALRGQLGARAILLGAGIYALTSSLELAWTLQLVDVHVDSYLGFAALVGAMVVAIASRLAWLHRQVEIGERDQLTGCFTRHGFRQRLEQALDRHDRGEAPLSCIMVDLDRFKELNDLHGHNFGDQVLTASAQGLARELRAGLDVVARWGGEEFLLLLPGTPQLRALDVAARVKAALHALRFEQRPEVRITASFGVAERKKGEPFDAWVARADRAMYAAKQAGRDCIRPAMDAA
ncbi:MAG: diguanylate cyclase [Archangiaceae bacterium]|nr:diguanylate cyclase [Archangiaceae bacterium]